MKKPDVPLFLVGSNVEQIGIEPPCELGEHGRRLWDAVMTEHPFRDVAGLEMLAAICQAHNRAERERIQIDQEGELVQSRQGMKEHPLLKSELANRSFVVKTLQRLGLNYEPVRTLKPKIGGY
jgi:hypothetical protein